AATERAERAEREAEAVRDEARSAADTIRTEAQAERDDILATAQHEAETVVEDGRTRGRDMVTEAQTVRERMLRDLARKRQTGRAQVEQLRAGRDRLLESLRTTQDLLDSAVEDLVNAVPEARAAAERAGLRVNSEATPTLEELEGEIEAARLVGHPLVEDLPATGTVLESDPFPTGEMESLAHLDALDEEASEGGDGDGEGEGEAAAADDEGEADDEEEEPSSAGAVAADDGPELYDVEAEEAADVDTGADDATDEEGVDPSEALFAKLRSSRAEEALDEDDDEEDEAEAEPAGPREIAAADAAKAMKKVLVEEQGTLLDGIRRSGAAAIEVVIQDEAAHDKAYDRAATPALRELVAALGGPKRLSLRAALGQIHAIALEPVRQRLREVAERVDDPDELSDTVRALYRESRSRRLPEAAAAAVVAVDGLVVLHHNKNGEVHWVVEEGGPCGPDCADNALAGDIAAGDEFPTGDRHPPAHPACTCHLEPAGG
ncbi:MAG: hypothetical protein GWN79_08505, partial [Actinobacteria bacterium]|nr:hypothetical protein [Actinomycetota bacterium]NIS31014.1 hypothetical protein [Actinomycetota bacterium]NIT95434.1 hypothetical protein [Actinomycetota bacterium]NIU19121.1 hypothetical protein [Actinomycetota bacterium]NIU66187.1 hypothetical protein [Actinomycetota bacterium]